MAEPHVMTALVEKYRLVSGQLEACALERERLQGQVSQLEAVIRMFRADYPVQGLTPRRTLKRVFLRRNIFMRTAMDILREATEPKSAAEITALAFEQQGQADAVPEILARFAKQLNNTLIGYAKEGKVLAHEEEWPWKWSVTAS